MRSLAGIATVLIWGAAGAASAQSLSTPTLSSKALSSKALSSQALSSQTSAAPFGDVSAAALLNQAAFAPRSYIDKADPISSLIEHRAYQPGESVERWVSGETRLSGSPDGPVDSLRVSVGSAVVTPGRLPLNLARTAQFETRDYEVAVTRDWPAALSYEGKGFGLDLTPHAGVGVTNIGGSAEAGAMLQFSKRESLDENASARLKALGLRDGARFGDRGRWYLFAAASGRAVGLNMLHNEAGWDRAGWSQDTASTLIGDAQVGVGWRKGPMQTSLGYIHREVKGAHMIWGQDTRPDDMVAFSLAIRPKK